MTTTGQKYPTSGTSVSVSPHLDDAWVTPTNIYADDASTASVTATSFDAGDQTYILRAKGFDFSSIPDNAIIGGVTCRLNTWYGSATGAANIDLLQLLNTSGVEVGTNQCATAVSLTTTNTTIVTKGGTADKWGNALTAAWVKDPDFGVGIGMIATAANSDVFVDYVTLEIEYTVPSPVSLANTAEGGSDGTVVTIGNSGGASGDAFDSVYNDTNESLQFSNTHAAHGSLAYKVQYGSSAGMVRGRWSASLGFDVWFRIYLYFTANPGIGVEVWSCSNAAGLCGRLMVHFSGQVQFDNAGGAIVLGSDNMIPLNQWFRVEGHVHVGVGSGHEEFKLFLDPDSDTPTETKTSGTTITTSQDGNEASQANYGTYYESGVINLAYWMDDIALSSTAYIGPASSGLTAVDKTCQLVFSDEAAVDKTCQLLFNDRALVTETDQLLWDVAALSSGAPTLQNYQQYATNPWNSFTTPKTVSVTDTADDALVCVVGGDNTGSTNPGVPVTTGLTWSRVESRHTNCIADISQVIDTAGGARTVSVSQTGGGADWGMGVFRFSDSSGFGGHASGAARQIAVNCSGDHSAVVVIIGDYGANSPGSREWLEVNGYKPLRDAGLEKVAYQDPGLYTSYVAYYPDVGLAGLKTVGLNLPSTGTWSIAALEVLGAPSGGLTAVDQTRQLVFSDEAAVDKTDQLLFNDRKAIDKTDQLLFTDRIFIDKTDALRFTDLAYVNKTDALRFSVIQAIAKTDALRFSVIQAIAKTDQLLFNDRAAIDKTDVLRFSVIQAVVKTDQLLFNVLAALTVVDKTNQLLFNARALASKTDQLLFNDLTFVNKTDQLLFNYLSAIVKTDALRFSDRALVTKTDQLLFNVLGVLTEVIKTDALRFSVIASIIKTDQLLFNDLVSIAKADALRFSVIASIVKTDQLLFNDRALVNKIDQLLFNVLVIGEVIQTRQLLFNDRAGIVKTDQFLFNDLSRVATKTNQLLFNILKDIFVSKSLSFADRENIDKYIQLMFDVYSSGSGLNIKVWDGTAWHISPRRITR